MDESANTIRLDTYLRIYIHVHVNSRRRGSDRNVCAQTKQGLLSAHTVHDTARHKDAAGYRTVAQPLALSLSVSSNVSEKPEAKAARNLKSSESQDFSKAGSSL